MLLSLISICIRKNNYLSPLRTFQCVHFDYKSLQLPENNITNGRMLMSDYLCVEYKVALDLGLRFMEKTSTDNSSGWKLKALNKKGTQNIWSWTQYALPMYAQCLHVFLFTSRLKEKLCVMSHAYDSNGNRYFYAASSSDFRFKPIEKCIKTSRADFGLHWEYEGCIQFVDWNVR